MGRRMDADDLSPIRDEDPLRALAAQDLDRLSLAELDGRVAALAAEIARTRSKRAAGAAVKDAADALFRRG